MDFNNLETRNQALGTNIFISPKEPTGEAVSWFVLSGTEGSYTSSGKVDDWMARNHVDIKDKNMREMSIPNSHDTGTFNVTQKTAAAAYGSIKTQTVDYYGQLMEGVRWFDIRPVRSTDNVWYSGHWTWVETAGLDWQGGNGAPIWDLLYAINYFTREHNELIILEINVNNVYVAGKSFDDLDNAKTSDWIELLEFMTNDARVGLRNLWKPTETFKKTNDLTQVPMGEFIGHDASSLRSAVVIIANETVKGFPLDGSRGVYPPSNFSYESSFSAWSKEDIRLSNWVEIANTRPWQAFSYCLNHGQTDTQAVLTTIEERTEITDVVGWTRSSILYNADEHARKFFVEMYSSTRADRFPAAFNVDGIVFNQYAALAMAFTQRSTKVWQPGPGGMGIQNATSLPNAQNVTALSGSRNMTSFSDNRPQNISVVS